MLGYNPQVIWPAAASMTAWAKYVAEQTVKHTIAADMPVKGADVIVLGDGFKENCLPTCATAGDRRDQRAEELRRAHDPIASLGRVRA